MKSLKFLMIRAIMFVGFWLLFPTNTQAEVIMVAHPSNPVNHLSSREIQSIYLFKKITWENGLRIVPIHLGAQDSLRKLFSKKWLERSLGEIENFYLMRALSGQGQPPLIFLNTKEVKIYLQKNRGAIAYIESKDLDDSVKEIIVERSGSGR